MVTRITGTERRYKRMRLEAGALRVNGVDYEPGAGQTVTLGNKWYVDSATGSDSNVGNLIEGPFATIGAAITAATANQGDIIYLLPNHAETITGAGGIALSKAGVSVVGLGVGQNRPRFLMDAGTTVTCTITAADVHIENVIFAAGHSEIVTCLGITAGGAEIIDCEFVENTTDENFLTEIKCTSTSDNNADGLTVIGCRAISVDSSALEFIEVNADIKGLWVDGNFISKKGSAVGYCVLMATGKDLQDYRIVNNHIVGAAAAVDLLVSQDTGSANWGIADDNRYGRIGNPNNSEFIPGLGYRVTKASTIASDPDDLFVATGKSLVTLMIGECTSVIATISSMSINSSTGSQVIAASTDVTTSVVGTLWIVTGDPDDGLNGSASGANRGADIATGTTGFHRPFLINDDNIYMNLNTTGTGLVQWDLWYIPMESGAYITSAA